MLFGAQGLDQKAGNRLCTALALSPSVIAPSVATVIGSPRSAPMSLLECAAARSSWRARLENLAAGIDADIDAIGSTICRCARSPAIC